MSLEDLNSAKVEECLALASQAFGQSFPYETIQYDLRGRSAGQLVMSRRLFSSVLPTFRFNTFLLHKYEHEFIEHVAPHECAHLIAFSVYGTKIRPHGKEWKAIMKDLFKLEPLVRHQFEIEPARQLKQFDYACGCEGVRHSLTSIRHNKVQRGTVRYKCKQCGECLSLEYE